jgi:flagellar biosynthesis protein FliR
MNKILRKFPIIIYYLLRINVVLAFFVFLYQKNWLNAVSVFIILVLFSVPTYMKRRLKINIPFDFELIAVAFIYLSIFLGDLQEFYFRFWWWDVYLHLASGFLLGIIGFTLVYAINHNKNIKMNMKAGFVAMFALFFSLSIGLFWEFFEYGVDSFFNTNMQRSGLPDTMWDLIMDFIGAFIISSLGYLWMKERLSFYFFDKTLKKFIKENQRLFE